MKLPLVLLYTRDYTFDQVLARALFGTGVVIGGDIFGYTFGNRVKLLHLIPEPKPFSIGIAAPTGRLSPAAEKFWQCAKEAASKK